MDTLGKLFGNSARVKLLRFLVFNPEETYDKKEIADRLQISPADAARELALLSKLGVARRKTCMKDTGRIVKGRPVRKKVTGWAFNQQFLYRDPLERFLLDTALLAKREFVGRLKSVGKLKLVLISGIFTRESASRLDLLIVGEQIKDDELERAMRMIEADVGKELRYAAFSPEDFSYRKSVQDRLVRDVIDFRHETLIDRIGL